MYTLSLLLFLSLAFGYRSDDGGHLDPNGGPCVGGLADEGNGFDPHGGRVTGQGDDGWGMDPNG